MCRIQKTVHRLALATLVAATLISPATTTAAEPTMAVRAQTRTYNVRLEAHYFGSVVGTTGVTFQAANEFQFRNAVGDAQRVFAQMLNDRKVKWNRITFAVVSVE